MRIRDEALYLCDNGAAYCGTHLGAAARASGWDISGQIIEEVSPEMAATVEGEGLVLRCERPGCGRTGGGG